MSTPTNLAALASTYLKAIGAPDTPGNRQAMAAWLKIESGCVQGTNCKEIKVVGNNPLNITGVGDCGYRNYVAHRFAIYCTPASGAAATARLLIASRYTSYHKIVAAFRANNPDAAILAIIASPWDGLNYWNHAHTSNSLINSYRSLSGINLTPPSTNTGDSGSGTGSGNTVSDITTNPFLETYFKPEIGKKTWIEVLQAIPGNGNLSDPNTFKAQAITSGLQTLGIDINSTITQADYNRLAGNSETSNTIGSIDNGMILDPIAKIATDSLFKIGAILLGLVLIVIGSKKLVDAGTP